MKPTISILLMTITLLYACNNKSKDIQSDPRAVADAIFDAARSGKTEMLASLVDAEADNDCKRIARAATDNGVREEFQKYFLKGKVTAGPVINGESASVSILFGPDGTQEETFEMVRKNGKWYLSSF